MENPASTIRNRLIDDLKLVVKDAEDLLRNTSSQAQAARTRFESTLSSVSDSLSTLEDRFLDTSREALDTAQDYVQKNPWQAIGISALAGLVVGVLISNRK